MDVRTLRFLAGFSQAQAAALAGVSVRTWRRWERREAPPAVVLRWLRYEHGQVPGWPPGWRARRDGIELPSGEHVPFSVIEAARWALQLVEGRERDRAYRIATAGSG